MHKNKIMYKKIKLAFFSIFYFFKISRKSRLPLFLIKYLYLCLINNLYKLNIFNLYKTIKIDIKFFDIYSKYNNLEKFNFLNYFNFFPNKLNSYLYYQKKNLFNLFEFQLVKNKLRLKFFLKNLENFFFDNINNILNLINLDIVKKQFVCLFFFKKNKQTNKFFWYLFKNVIKQNTFSSHFKKYQEIFILPAYINLKKKKIGKFKIRDFKFIESIFFFKFIRRFRTLFFLYIFFLLLFWFNKLLLKINFNRKFHIIDGNCKIQFFNNLKIIIGLNIKFVWLYSNILIPNYNLNYMLYNNIKKYI